MTNSDKSKKLTKLESLVRDFYKTGIASGHSHHWANWLYENHVFVVGDYVKEISKDHNFNLDVAIASAWLHDIADAIMGRFDDNHKEKSLEISKNILTQAGFNTTDIDQIITDILPKHGCYPGNAPQTPEGQAMATADAMAHILSNFYDFTKQKFLEEGSTLQEYNTWLLAKLDRDYYDKIFFTDIRNRVKDKYEKLKKQAGLH